MAKFKFDAVLRVQVRSPEGVRAAGVGASAMGALKLVPLALTTGALATLIALAASLVLDHTGWSVEALVILMLNVAR